MKEQIVGIGEILWDIFLEGKEMGGAPANFAYHVSQFGLSGCVVSSVGNDANGDEIIKNLNNKNLQQLVTRVDYPTGYVTVTVDNNGIPQYDIKENVAWDNIPFTPSLETLAHSTKALCFGTLSQRNSISRDTIARFIDAMPKDDGTLIVYDINLRQNFYNKEVIEQSLKRCNILKINDEELEVITPLLGLPDGDESSRCSMLMEKYNIKIVILTCGVKGSYVFTADNALFHATPKVTVVDTVGAGDSFTAAFVASLIKGSSIAEAHDIAVRTSAYVCTQKGAMPLLPPI